MKSVMEPVRIEYNLEAFSINLLARIYSGNLLVERLSMFYIAASVGQHLSETILYYRMHMKRMKIDALRHAFLQLQSVNITKNTHGPNFIDLIHTKSDVMQELNLEHQYRKNQSTYDALLVTADLPQDHETEQEFISRKMKEYQRKQKIIKESEEGFKGNPLITPRTAKEVVQMIINNKIPHIKINFNE
jgi:hypothetical protein